MASRRQPPAAAVGAGALLFLITALATAPCALCRAPLLTPVTSASAHSQQEELSEDPEAGIGRSLFSSAEGTAAAGVAHANLNLHHRSLMQRKKGGHPPGVGKHGPGKGRHPPGVGGHRRRKQAAQAKQSASSFAAASTSNNNNGYTPYDSNGQLQVAQVKTSWCPEAPANFSEDLVNQINIRKIIDETPHLTVLPRIGRNCETAPADFDASSGSQNLCVKGAKESEYPPPPYSSVPHCLTTPSCCAGPL